MLLASTSMLIHPRDITLSLRRCCKIPLQSEVSFFFFQARETIRLIHFHPDTLYYSLWIEGNADETYVDEYDSKHPSAVDFKLY